MTVRYVSIHIICHCASPDTISSHILDFSVFVRARSSYPGFILSPNRKLELIFGGIMGFFRNLFNGFWFCQFINDLWLCLDKKSILAGLRMRSLSLSMSWWLQWWLPWWWWTLLRNRAKRQNPSPDVLTYCFVPIYQWAGRDVVVGIRWQLQKLATLRQTPAPPLLLAGDTDTGDQVWGLVRPGWCQ